MPRIQVGGGSQSGASTGASSLAPTAVKTAAYTAAASDLVPVDTTSGNVTITLPTAPTDKTQIGVKHVVRGGTNTVSVAAGGTDRFNITGGSATLTLTLLNQSAVLQYSSATGLWYVVSTDIPLGQLDSRFAPIGSAGVTATVDGTTATALALTTGVTPADIGAARQVPTWTASTTYKAGELVVNAGLLYQANADFTSGATFNGTNWTGVGSVNAVYGAIPPDYGYGAWTGDPLFFPTGGAPSAAGVVQLFKVKVPLTITITNIVVDVFTAGAGLSNCYAAVYDSTGAQLGVSSDQTTNWQAAGLRSATLGTPAVVQGGASVNVYIALLVGAATTLPLFYKSATGSTLQFAQGKVGGAARMGLYGTSLTAMPASLTLTSITAGSYSFWAATS